MQIDTHELAWAAGFFDGEGSIMWRGNGKVSRNELSISVAQADIQPLARFYEAIGRLGSFRGPYYHKNKKHKPYWVVSTNGLQSTQAVIALLWNWLSDPKKDKATVCLKVAVASYAERKVKSGWPGGSNAENARS